MTQDERDAAGAAGSGARGAAGNAACGALGAPGGGRYPDVLVVGGGLIGLVSAWRAAQAGLAVSVLDAGERHAAWRAAAGMLAPVTEAEHGEEAILALGLRSAALWPGFAAELAEASGLNPAHRAAGTLAVARDRDDAEALEREYALQRAHGLDATRLRPTQARRAEPALAPSVRLAVDVPGDRAVDPRALRAALEAAARNAGAAIHDARVTAVTTHADRVTGVALDSGERMTAGCVLLAAGAWTSRLEGLPPDAAVPVRPVKGQVLRLRDPRGPGLVTRSLRTRDAYLVPRTDGRYVLGATVEERGWDLTPTAGGVFELLRDISEVVPGIFELELEEILCGARPCTPDNLAAIGCGALDGLMWATGHHRNGVLLTPVTGELVRDALLGRELPEWAAAAAPERFTKAAVPA